MNQDYCSIKKNLLEKINASLWWHLPPCDPMAHTKQCLIYEDCYKSYDY